MWMRMNVLLSIYKYVRVFHLSAVDLDISLIWMVGGC